MLKVVQPEKRLLHGFRIAVYPEYTAFFSVFCHVASDPIQNADSRAHTVAKYHTRVNAVFADSGNLPSLGGQTGQNIASPVELTGPIGTTPLAFYTILCYNSSVEKDGYGTRPGEPAYLQCGRRGAKSAAK
jgi:hypothetical protein